MTIPEPKKPADRSPIRIDGDESVLILPDAHIPYHDKAALELAVSFGKKLQPSVVLINGDFADNYSFSPHETDPSKRDMIGEIATVKQGLAWIQNEFRKARIIYKQGNHELWWDRKLWSKAPELVGLPSTTWEAQVKPDKSRIEFIHHLKAINIGTLLVLHGHEYRFAISNPVNPARGLFLRTKVTSLCSHFHQRSEHSERDGNGKLITTWSTGCLCQISPDYASRNNWSHGFAFVELHDKDFDVQNLRIIKGKVYS